MRGTDLAPITLGAGVHRRRLASISLGAGVRGMGLASITPGAGVRGTNLASITPGAGVQGTNLPSISLGAGVHRRRLAPIAPRAGVRGTDLASITPGAGVALLVLSFNFRIQRLSPETSRQLILLSSSCRWTRSMRNTHPDHRRGRMWSPGRRPIWILPRMGKFRLKSIHQPLTSMFLI